MEIRKYLGLALVLLVLCSVQSVQSEHIVAKGVVANIVVANSAKAPTPSQNPSVNRSPNQSIPECGIDLFFGGCEKLNNSGLVFRKDKDGTALLNVGKILISKDKDLVVNSKDLKRLSSPLMEGSPEYKRLERIFNEVKGAVLEVLLEGKDKQDPKLTDQQKALALRVQTLGFQAENVRGVCGNAGVNGGYISTNHTIDICPALARFPEEGLFFLLAHEFGHVIEPCFMARPLYRVHHPLPQKASCDESSLLVLERINFLANVEYLVPQGEKSGDTHLILRESKLLECGFVEMPEFGKPLIQPEIKSEITSEMKSQDSSYGKLLDSVRAKAELKNISNCGRSTKGNEVLADSLATLALEVKLRGKESNTKDGYTKEHLTLSQIQNITLFFSSIECASREPGGSFLLANPNYPLPRERLSILLQNPTVQEKFNCRHPSYSSYSP